MSADPPLPATPGGGLPVPVRGRVRRLHAALLGIAVALVLSDSSIVVLALPDILARYRLDIGEVAWVLTGFNLVLMLAAVPVAYLVRRRAPGALFGIGLVVFAAASLTCALAPSYEVLIGARAVQAVGGALAITAALELLPHATGSERSAAYVWATAGALGAAFGPAVGGILTQLISWEAIFFVQVPAILLALPFFRVRAVAAQGTAGRPRIAPNLALLFLSAGLTAALFLIVLLLIEGWQMTPIATALVVSVMPVAAIIGARAIGDRGSLPVRAAAGTILLAGGLAALAVLPAPVWWWTVPPQVLIGLGLGMTIGALTNAAVRGRSPQAVHGGWTIAARHAGIVLGIVALTPVFTADLAREQSRVERSGVTLLLEAPLPLADRVALAGRLGVLVDGARGRIPDIDVVFADAPADPAQRIAWFGLRDALVAEIREAGTRAAARSFLLAAGFALLALVPIALARRRIDL